MVPLKKTKNSHIFYIRVVSTLCLKITLTLYPWRVRRPLVVEDTPLQTHDCNLMRNAAGLNVARLSLDSSLHAGEPQLFSIKKHWNKL